MDKPVLLTGGAGDLGQVVSRRLDERGDTAIRLDVRPPNDEFGEYIEGSILDREKLAGYFKDVDVVVHIAAWHGVHEARGWKSEDEFWDLNVTGTYNVFQACVKADVKKIIYISSTSVEDNEGFYGFTKRQGEDIAHDFARRHDLYVIILRPRAFIPYWNRAVYSSFVEWAQWFWKGAVHIEDVCQAVMLSIDLLRREKLENVMSVTIDGAYEFTNDDLDNWDINGVGSSFEKYYREFTPVVKQHGIDMTVKPSKKDISEAQRHLGYQPIYGLRNLLEELREYGETGPPKPK